MKYSSSEIAGKVEKIFSDPRKKEDFLKSLPKYDNISIIEMENLINDKSTKEKDMRDFFLKYPWFIGLEYSSIEKQRKLGERNIPDYLLKRIVNGHYDLIEIKGPNDHIFNKNKSGYQFNQYFVKGLLQVMRYIDFCDKHHDYIFSEHKKMIYKPKGILLIDNILKKTERESLNMFTSFLNRIIIKTYDEIYCTAINAKKLIEEHYIT